MPALPRLERIYQSHYYDSVRWQHISHRPGDIVVSSAPKSGTTWTQMICAVLIHKSPHLPQPLNRLSRWIERTAEPVEDVERELKGQTHRRILKSHTPLDGIPFHQDASYVVCGRDPRDAFLSMVDQLHNISDKSFARSGRTFATAFPFPIEPNALFTKWINVPQHPWMADGFVLGSATYLPATFWRFKHLPNIHFVHYADLKRDLDDEMRRLAQFLKTDIDETAWPAFLKAASFAAMKTVADDAAPGAQFGEWRRNKDFFRRARLGEWSTVLTKENQTLYEETMTARLEPEFKAWLEGGRLALNS